MTLRSIDTDDSYSAARIRAARSRLIKRAEYDRLMRMSDPETLQYLQTSAYRPSVEALGVKDLDDLEAIDRVIALHEDNALRTLTRSATPRYRPLVSALRTANDVWNIRVAAEAIVGGLDLAATLERFARPGAIAIARLIGARTLPDLDRLAGMDLRRLRDAPDDLSGFLDALERAHAAEPLPEGPAGALLADERNLTRVLRCAREGIPVERAIAGTSRGGTISRGTLRRIAGAKDLAEGLRLLRGTRYAQAAERAMRVPDSIPLRAESEIHRAVLRSIARASRADPIGPDALARHVAEMGMESANLRLLVKARRLGLDEAFVRDRLAVP